MAHLHHNQRLCMKLSSSAQPRRRSVENIKRGTWLPVTPTSEIDEHSLVGWWYRSQGRLNFGIVKDAKDSKSKEGVIVGTEHSISKPALVININNQMGIPLSDMTTYARIKKAHVGGT